MCGGYGDVPSDIYERYEVRMTDKTFKDDQLGYTELGETFTKLVQSIGGSKVISIEAGFGRGKTFFRKRWATQLRAAGEVVIEIDARQSDHSGDPVVTFIGALVGALGTDEETRLAKAKKAGLKYTGVAARILAKAVLRQGAEDLIEAVEGRVVEEDDNALLKSAVEGFGDGMSKFAGEVIAAQLQAEKARQEMPEQLDALRLALTDGNEDGRVVILIDELDRCHPDYAIALLEAMKLVFDRPGYVFVLMVNSDHLERIAAHRFVGWHKEGEEAREPYLEKFVDMRLKLEPKAEKIGEAARAFAMELPEPEIPFGEGPEFTVERAAQVAADLAPLSGLSPRQIKRVLLRVELAVRCYREVPVDVALLVWLGLLEMNSASLNGYFNILPRASLLPEAIKKWDAPDNWRDWDDERIRRWRTQYRAFFEKFEDSFSGLTDDRFRLNDESIRRRPDFREKLLLGLAPWYIPAHQAMLDQVHNLVAD